MTWDAAGVFDFIVSTKAGGKWGQRGLQDLYFVGRRVRELWVLDDGTEDVGNLYILLCRPVYLINLHVDHIILHSILFRSQPHMPDTSCLGPVQVQNLPEP